MSAEQTFVQAMATSPSGRLVAWVEEPMATWPSLPHSRIRAADTESGKVVLDVEVEPLQPPGTFGALAVAPNEKTIAFGGGQDLGVVDGEKSEILWHRCLLAAGAYDIAYCPDSASFFAIDSGGQVT